jgi:hypothetical protein
VESDAKAQRYSVLTYPVLVVGLHTASEFKEDLKEKGACIMNLAKIACRCGEPSRTEGRGSCQDYN